VEIIYERVAGIDVGKKIIAVAVRTPGERAGKRRQELRKFNTYHRTLTEMVAWLVAEGVTHVTMEATGVYWRPVFHALCEAERPLEVLLVNARHVKNVPGRKSDALDAVWLAELTECGLLRGSFIPPPQIAAIRELTRYRKKLIEQRTSELQRLAKVLEDGGIKIDSVASALTTLSARDMIEALINGERDPAVLAELARGKMRSKIPDLRLACAGRFGAQHALMCTLHLEHINHLTDMIARLDTRIDEASLPFARPIELLATIPGSVSAPPRSSSPRSVSTWPDFPPRRTWPPGLGCAQATTNPPASTAQVGPARAARSSARSSPSAPGPPGAPVPTWAPSSAASTGASARRVATRPPLPPPHHDCDHLACARRDHRLPRARHGLFHHPYR
jgi:transposase